MEVFRLKKFLSVALSATMMASTGALAPSFSAKTVDKATTRTSESAT